MNLTTHHTSSAPSATASLTPSRTSSRDNVANGTVMSTMAHRKEVPSAMTHVPVLENISASPGSAADKDLDGDDHDDDDEKKDDAKGGNGEGDADSICPDCSKVKSPSPSSPIKKSSKTANASMPATAWLNTLSPLPTPMTPTSPGAATTTTVGTSSETEDEKVFDGPQHSQQLRRNASLLSPHQETGSGGSNSGAVVAAHGYRTAHSVRWPVGAHRVSQE